MFCQKLYISEIKYNHCNINIFLVESYSSFLRRACFTDWYANVSLWAGS